MELTGPDISFEAELDLTLGITVPDPKSHGIKYRAMTKEEHVKENVKRIFKAFNAFWFMPVASGYGKQGIPDFISCYRGRFIAVETKYGKNKTTSMQDLTIERIRECHGVAIIVNESNLDLLYVVLCRIDAILALEH